MRKKYFDALKKLQAELNGKNKVSFTKFVADNKLSSSTIKFLKDRKYIVKTSPGKWTWVGAKVNQRTVTALLKYNRSFNDKKYKAWVQKNMKEAERKKMEDVRNAIRESSKPVRIKRPYNRKPKVITTKVFFGLITLKSYMS